MSLSESQQTVARVLADTLFPGGDALPAGGAIVPENLASFLETIAPEKKKGLLTALSLFEYAALILLYGGRFSRLSDERRERYVESWMRSRIATRRIIYRALRDTFAFLYYQDPRTWEGIAYPGPPVGLKRD
ncbi:MAG: hypothetical protein KC609_18110 [Myxococcales bacterium]|nr:hypothetical protein [Myxococcales bacterium]